ncbi:hypothetical protein DT075_05815 [Bacillus licheniformis]|nr:hypothetical protein DT075_05815 [Bacillus licheniformis]
MLVKQINAAIKLHEQVFYFMYQRGLYPAYNLVDLLKGDAMHAQKAISMRKIKKSMKKISDPQLRQLYSVSAKALEQNLRELLPFLPKAPAFQREDERADLYFDAGDLLVLAKTTVIPYYLTSPFQNGLKRPSDSS